MWGTDMRRPSRIRWWFKWAGVTACVLLSMMWVFSIWGYVSRRGRIGSMEGTGVALSRQSLDFLLTDGGNLLTVWDAGWVEDPKLILDLPQLRVMVQPHCSRSLLTTTYKYFKLPLWLLFLLTAIPTGLLFWRDRRIPPGYCQKCRYDLTGNTSGICTEC